MDVKIADIQFSMVDWDGHPASIVFCIGCNFNCMWCYNKKLLTSESMSWKEVEYILNRNKQHTEYVVISGGEPTIQTDLYSFIRMLKKQEFKVKLDTNGSNPDVLKQCLPYVDYVAMDLKSPSYTYRIYSEDACIAEKIRHSIDVIKLYSIGLEVDYEFRLPINAVDGEINLDYELQRVKELEGVKRIIYQPLLVDGNLTVNKSKLEEFIVEIKKHVDWICEVKLRW